jgi:hypothetical protein
MPLYQPKEPSFFPPPSSEKIHYPLGVTNFVTASVPQQNKILYMPYYIKKSVSNPTLLIQQTGTGGNTIKVGIYDGRNGLYGSNLLVGDEIITTATPQIYTKQVTINLNRGYYILAGLMTTANSSGYRIATAASAREAFGDDSTITTIDNNNFYNEAGSSLPSTIGTIAREGITTNCGVNVFIKY